MMVMRMLIALFIAVTMAWPALAVEEGARPEIVDVLTARLANASNAEDAAEIAGALRDVYSASDSASAEVLYAQAEVVTEEGDTVSALYKLDRTLDIDEDMVAALVLRGTVRLQVGEVDGAFQDAMDAVEAAPDYYAGLGLLANAFEARGYFASALATTREALKYYPLNEELNEQLDRHERMAAGLGL